jgi:hypothetical protein
VVIIPGSCGRIAEYIYKPLGINQFIELVSEEIEILPGYNIGSTNYAGYEDWIWELKQPKGITSYEATIIEKAPSRCSISLKNKGVLDIERVVTIYEGSTEVNVVTKLTYTGNEARDYSYWAHVMVKPGGANAISDIIQYIPISDKREGRGRKLVYSDKAEVFAERFNIGSSGSFFYSPLQSWWASVNQKNKIALIQHVNVDNIGKEGLFYCWCNDNIELGEYSMSMEVIYDPFEFSKGKGNTYEMSIITCAGVEKIMYADKNIIISGVSQTKKDSSSGANLEVGISAPHQIVDATLKVSLLSDKNTIIGSDSTIVPILHPNDRTLINFDFSNIKLSSGDYFVAFEMEDTNGKSLSSFRLLDAIKIEEVK